MRVLYYILILVPLWLDSPLYQWFGAYGYAVTPLLSIALIVPYILLRLYTIKVKGISCNGLLDDVFTQRWFRLAMYLVAINVIADSAWLTTGGAAIVRQEDIVIKSIKGIVTIFSSLSYLIIVTDLGKRISQKDIYRPFVIGFIILGIVGVVELAQAPYALEAVHFSGEFPYWRMRLLTSEASWTALQILVYGCVSLHYFHEVKKSLVGTFVTGSIFLFLYLNSMSKALLIMTIVLVIIGFAHLIRKDARYVVPVFGLLLLVALNYESVFENLIYEVNSDLNGATSIATRSYTNAIGLLYCLLYPLGTGNSLYLALYPDMLTNYLDIFQELSIDLNITEIMGLITGGTDASLSPKSGVLAYGMYWGIFGTVYLFYSYYRLWKTHAGSSAFTALLGNAFICAIIAITFTSTMEDYCFFALIALMQAVDYRNKERSALQ